MARSFLSYVKAAFNARPWGMFIAPNWVGLAAFAIAGGFVDWGFWVIGAGTELAYLLTLASSKRFQRVVDGTAAVKRAEIDRIQQMLIRIPPDDINRYSRLQTRCREILQEQQGHGADVSVQSEGLSRLVLLYLQLLVTRQNLQRVIREAERAEDLQMRVEQLQKQLESESISPELRNSLQGQLEILQNRLSSRQEANDKLSFVNAELVRIQEQVELVREQSALSSDPSGLSAKIDAITGSLTQTGQWIREQQQILGRVDDLTAEPPPLLLDEGQMQRQ
jgi:hypothetical protein